MVLSHDPSVKRYQFSSSPLAGNRDIVVTIFSSLYVRASMRQCVRPNLSGP